MAGLGPGERWLGLTRLRCPGQTACTCEPALPAAEPLPTGFRLARETVAVEQRLEKETHSLGPALRLPACPEGRWDLGAQARGNVSPGPLVTFRCQKNK